jgi:hypothetical protein
MSFKNITRFMHHEFASEICLLVAFGALMYALISPFLNI